MMAMAKKDKFGNSVPSKPVSGKPLQGGTTQRPSGADQFGGVGSLKPGQPANVPASSGAKSDVAAAKSAVAKKSSAATTPSGGSPTIPAGAPIQQKPKQTPTQQQTPAQTAAQVQAAATPVDWEQAAKELYGGYFSIVQSVPELQDLLRRATLEKWSDAKFEYELRQTNWWKTSSSTAREWDLQSQMDPATAQQQVDTRVVELQNMALSQFQVSLSDSQLRKLATDSLRWNWSQQMVSNAIGLEATRMDGGISQLAAGFVGQNIRQTANQYGLRLSQDSLDRWVTSIATGQETSQRFQQYAMNTAKSLFPAISQQIDSGLTFQQIVDPYRNVASQILEIAPNQIDFLDPKWARAISLVDNSGQQRPMSFSEWGDYLRQTPSFGYEYTSDAQSKAYQVANSLANLFGKA